jgi:hypothetical protein
MGVVYLARDTALNRPVALKALPSDTASDDASRKRLKREAQLAAGIAHPNVAVVHDLFEDPANGHLYLVSEYVRGSRLRERLAVGPLPLEELLDLAVQLASGLSAAHEGKVVHRDLKPENLMISPGRCLKILDFGLARKEGFDSSRITSSGTVVGTVAYMSPEQARGSATDFRTDLFSFGLIVFEMATGRNPFEGENFSATYRLRLEDFEPPSLAAAWPSCPLELERIVSTCLQCEPARRYASTAELVEALTGLKRGSRPFPAPAPAPAPRRDTAARWWKTHLAVVSLAYAGMIYPAWHVRTFLPSNLGPLLALLELAAATAAVATRLHLWFTYDVEPEELQALHAKTWWLIAAADLLFSLALLGTAAGIYHDHQEFAMLFVLVPVLLLIAAMVIEPTTMRRLLKRSQMLPRPGGASSH